MASLLVQEIKILKGFSRRQNTTYKNFFFIVIFRLHLLEKAVFKMKRYKDRCHNLCIIRYSLMVFHFHKKRLPKIRRDVAGVQPEIFQGRGGFVKLGRFDKHFIQKSRKKVPQAKKIWSFFFLDTLKTTF